MKKTRYFLFPLLVALTFWIILRESSLTQIFDCLRTCSPSALAAAIGCMVVFVHVIELHGLTAGGKGRDAAEEKPGQRVRKRLLAETNARPFAVRKHCFRARLW